MSGTLGDLRPQIEALERATGKPVRVFEAPDGRILLDFTSGAAGTAKTAEPLRGASRRERRRKRRRGTV